MATATLHVPDISCEHCERGVITALTRLGGVHSVTVDIPAKQVRVAYDDTRTSLEAIKQALQEEDYPITSAAAG